ncbi:MAG: LysM peptidoglycan-binding domain-containing protein [Lachnospiraceae bacterium]|nr:LysM peptidoglycan-binding domain-containing protein [Lachnospiraceae bacterium]
MELPKNIVQIGTPDKRYKVFVEDYVISYMKQINRNLQGGQAGLALYGKRYAEEDMRYYFLYGACEIAGLESRGQYLSETEKERAEAKRAEFFEEQEFLAWCTLTGEMPDGFFLLEQGKGLPINGYATFFEKNDNMLNFMIIMGNREDKRINSNEQENTGAELYERKRGETRRSTTYEWGRLAEGGNIDHRLLERSRKLSEARKEKSGLHRNYRMASQKTDKYEKNGSWKTLFAGMAVMLCVLGIATLSDEEKMKELQVLAGQVMQNLSEKQLPDAENLQTQSTEAMWQETQTSTESTVAAEVAPESVVTAETIEQNMEQTDTPPVAESEQSSEIVPEESEPPENSEPDKPTVSVEEVVEPETPESVEETVSGKVSYVVQKGDMLLNICKKHYGTEERLQEICELNGISNPDDIKVGQIILLPE